MVLHVGSELLHPLNTHSLLLSDGMSRGASFSSTSTVEKRSVM